MFSRLAKSGSRLLFNTRGLSVKSNQYIPQFVYPYDSFFPNFAKFKLVSKIPITQFQNMAVLKVLSSYVSLLVYNQWRLVTFKPGMLSKKVPFIFRNFIFISDFCFQISSLFFKFNIRFLKNIFSPQTDISLRQ